MSSLRERLSEAVETRTGLTIERKDRVELLEASDVERRALQKELDLLAYTALDYTPGGNPQEMKPNERRALTQKARVVWMRDPQAGAAVDLMNDFVFGRGIPKPKAADPAVQDVIDEAWEDPDNQLVLTSYDAQLAVGTDLSLQSNLFFVVFDEGEDGKVKLGLLNHDTVETVVRDPDNRLRILYYLAREREYKWDFKNDSLDMQILPTDQKKNVRYYPHWRNVEAAVEEGRQIDTPPAEKLGDGKVFHVAINRGTEMAFGHPVMDRTLRWFNAYNAFMEARLDIIRARAAFVMKRKIKGTEGQLRKIATQALSRRSALGAAVEGQPLPGPKPGAILDENESVTHEELNMDTGAAGAMQDGQMLRAQVSAAHRWPQSFLGDPSSTDLATATSLELPVLKGVETRQEIVEAVVRFFVDRTIERAVEAGRITEELTPEEIAALKKEQGDQEGDQEEPEKEVSNPGMALVAGYEDQPQDEAVTQRDLSYEFSMPSPLRRMMADLVTAVMNIAQTFDPNNTNPELSRTLLTIALGEGLEMEDPAKAVEKIFPPGYKDPAVAAAENAQAMSQLPPGPPQAPGTDQFGEFSPATATGADGKQHSAANPYGAKQRARPPEVTMQQAVTRGRDGREIHWPLRLTPAIEEAAPTPDDVDGLFDVEIEKAFANGNGRR